MIRTIALSALAATAVLSACTPQPAGVCEADTACKGDERCHQGLCIKRSLLGDGGSAADGGEDGAPTLSTTWSGGPWRSAAGTFVVPATVNDDHGVASARLDVQLADGGTARFNATLSGSSATFNVPAAGLAVPGAAVALPFTIAATDLAGNTAALAPAPGRFGGGRPGPRRAQASGAPRRAG